MDVVIERQQDGSFIAYNTEYDGTIIGTGSTVSEAKEDFFNSQKELKESCESEGLSIPDIASKEPVFRFVDKDSLE